MKKQFSVMLFIMILVILIVIGKIYQDNKDETEFELFYSTNLSGRIIKIDKYSRGAHFMLSGNRNEFVFYPQANKQLNDGEIFQYLAEPGDSVYKAAFTDTMFLYKEDKMYRYIFQKIRSNE